MNLIFDVDGTLVQSYPIHSACFIAALHEVLGPVTFRDDLAAYPVETDAGLLAQIAADNGFDPEAAAAVKPRFLARLEARLAQDPGACPEVPGATTLISRLSTDDDVRLGVATGGWPEAVGLKLANAGFDLPPGALFTGADGKTRAAILAACLAGCGDPANPTVYVGDGEWDAATAADLGWGFIGVGPRLEGRAAPWIADYRGHGFDRALDAFR